MPRQTPTMQSYSTDMVSQYVERRCATTSRTLAGLAASARATPGANSSSTRTDTSSSGARPNSRVALCASRQTEKSKRATTKTHTHTADADGMRASASESAKLDALGRRVWRDERIRVGLSVAVVANVVDHQTHASPILARTATGAAHHHGMSTRELTNFEHLSSLSEPKTP